MTDSAAIEQLIAKVRDYAHGRSDDVTRGAETAQLAALLVQKYGSALVDAVSTIGGMHARNRVQAAVDEETARIDSQWQENAWKRWAARLADISLGRLD